MDVQHLHVKCLFLWPDCKENRLFSLDFRKKFSKNILENLSTGRRVISCGRTDGRMEGHDEANSCFSNFCLRG